MTTTDPAVTRTHEIDDYLDTTLVENLADKGAFMNIKVAPGNVDKVSVCVCVCVCVKYSGPVLTDFQACNFL